MRADLVLDKVENVLRILESIRVIRSPDYVEEYLNFLMRLQGLGFMLQRVFRRTPPIRLMTRVKVEVSILHDGHVALVIHDQIELLFEHIRGELLRVRLLPLVVERLDLEGVVVLDAGQRRETVCTSAVIKVVSQLEG